MTGLPVERPQARLGAMRNSDLGIDWSGIGARNRVDQNRVSMLAETARSVEKLADVAGKLAEGEIREDAVTAAGNAVLLRDPEGRLMAPEKRSTITLYGRAYNAAVAERYIGEVSMDVRKKGVEMALAHRFDPDGFQNSWTAYQGELVKSADPALRGKVAVEATQIGSQHFMGLMKEKTEKELRDARDLAVFNIEQDLRDFQDAARHGAHESERGLAVIAKVERTVEGGLNAGFFGPADRERVRQQLGFAAASGTVSRIVGTVDASDIGQWSAAMTKLTEWQTNPPPELAGMPEETRSRLLNMHQSYLREKRGIVETVEREGVRAAGIAAGVTEAEILRLTQAGQPVPDALWQRYQGQTAAARDPAAAYRLAANVANMRHTAQGRVEAAQADNAWAILANLTDRAKEAPPVTLAEESELMEAAAKQGTIGDRQIVPYRLGQMEGTLRHAARQEAARLGPQIRREQAAAAQVGRAFTDPAGNVATTTEQRQNIDIWLGQKAAQDGRTFTPDVWRDPNSTALTRELAGRAGMPESLLDFITSAVTGGSLETAMTAVQHIDVIEQSNQLVAGQIPDKVLLMARQLKAAVMTNEGNAAEELARIRQPGGSLSIDDVMRQQGLDSQARSEARTKIASSYTVNLPPEARSQFEATLATMANRYPTWEEASKAAWRTFTRPGQWNESAHVTRPGQTHAFKPPETFRTFRDGSTEWNPLPWLRDVVENRVDRAGPLTRDQIVEKLRRVDSAWNESYRPDAMPVRPLHEDFRLVIDPSSRPGDARYRLMVRSTAVGQAPSWQPAMSKDGGFLTVPMEAMFAEADRQFWSSSMQSRTERLRNQPAFDPFGRGAEFPEVGR